jgi:uncharacterized protein YndB with AHSA1/START domain
MPVIERTVRIGAPPETVARILLDVDCAPEWTAGLERLELVAGEPGQPGCVGHAHYVEKGRRYVLEDVLLDVTPNRRYRSRIRGGGISTTVQTTLTPIGDGHTQLTLQWNGRGTNLLTMCTLPLMKRRIAQRTDADLRSLRRLAEASWPDGCDHGSRS